MTKGIDTRNAEDVRSPNMCILSPLKPVHKVKGAFTRMSRIEHLQTSRQETPTSTSFYLLSVNKGEAR